MPAIVLNIVIGLVTSILSGSAVWLWQRIEKRRVAGRKAAFFGIEPGGKCLIVMNNKWNTPGSTHQNDVHAMIEIAALATELGGSISVRSCDDIRESNADRTEFCLGGPSSNPRSAAYLATCVPGIRQLPFSAAHDSLAIQAGDQRFLYEPQQREHAVVAKFTPAASARPVILICGQTAITNRAAVHLLKRDYRQLMRSVADVDQFCLVVRVTAPEAYGHEMVEVAHDVSDAAFAPRQAPAAAAGDSARV